MNSAYRIKIEPLLFLIIVIGGGALRLIDLSGEPLAAEEGTYALHAWQLLNGHQTILDRAPLVTLATALSFFLLGASDAVARLMPALAGTALIALPWLLRSMLGRWTVVIMSLLLAISPSLIYFSRHLSSFGFASFFAIFLIVSFFRYRRDQSSGWLRAIGLGLACLVSSGSLGIGIALIFALYIALMISFESPKGRRSIFREKRREIAQSGLLAVGVFVILNTAFLTRVPELVLPSLSAWTMEFNLFYDSPPWYTLPGLALAYEPLVLVFGLLGAVSVVRNLKLNKSGQALRELPVFLTLWSISAFFLLVLSGQKSSGLLLILIIPLTLQSGQYLSEFLAALKSRDSFKRWPLALAVLMPLITSIILFNKYSLPDLESSGLILLVALLTFLPAFFLIVVVWHPRFRSQAALSISLLLLITGIFTIHSSFRLNFGSSSTEPLALAATSQDVLDLTGRLNESPQIPGSTEAKSISLDTGMTHPLAWYLREHDLTLSKEPDLGADVIIVSSEWRGESLGKAAMTGTLRRGWSPPYFDLSGIWRWLLTGKAYGPSDEQGFVAYIHL